MTTDKQRTITGLIERLEKATEASRELDGAIEVLARRFDAYRAGLDDDTRAYWQHNGCTVYDGNTGYDAQRFTASIDASLALVGRLLPGWSYQLTKTKHSVAELWKADEDGFVTGDYLCVKPTEAATLPLAILLSLCLALRDAHHV